MSKSSTRRQNFINHLAAPVIVAGLTATGAVAVAEGGSSAPESPKSPNVQVALGKVTLGSEVNLHSDPSQDPNMDSVSSASANIVDSGHGRITVDSPMVVSKQNALGNSTVWYGFKEPKELGNKRVWFDGTDIVQQSENSSNNYGITLDLEGGTHQLSDLAAPENTTEANLDPSTGQYKVDGHVVAVSEEISKQS